MEKTIWIILDKTSIEFVPIAAFTSREEAYKEAEGLELEDYDVMAITLFEE